MEQHTAFVINIYKLGNIFYKRHKQTAKQLVELEILQNAKQLEAQLQNGVVFKKKTCFTDCPFLIYFPKI